MTTAPRKHVLSGMKIPTDLSIVKTEARLVPNITNTFADTLSGNLCSMALGLGAGASQ
ncbi:MAG: hypothetical protein RL768_518 [Nitrospirota bacterium]|jgi:hypothetical protein